MPGYVCPSHQVPDPTHADVPAETVEVDVTTLQDPEPVIITVPAEDEPKGKRGRRS